MRLALPLAGALAIAFPLEASGCRLAFDALVLLEDGRPVSAPMSYMIAEEKAAPQNGGWLPCIDRSCGKRRDQALIFGDANDAVVCVLPGAKPFFSFENWSTLIDSPARVCEKAAKKRRCEHALYVEYVQEKGRSCRRVVVPLPKGDVGVVPYRKSSTVSGGPGECVLQDRCFQLDVVRKITRPCTRAQIKDRFQGVEFTQSLARTAPRR